MDQKLVDALLDIYDRTEEATQALQNLGDIKYVIRDDLLEELHTAEDSLTFIDRIVTTALGGTSKLMLLQDEREKRELDRR